MPHVPFRYVLNSLLYILITGCRWCDLPQGKIWASKSSAYAERYPLGHRWLKRWQEDGTFEHLQSRILAIADNQGLINWNFVVGALVSRLISLKKAVEIMGLEVEALLQILEFMNIEFSYLSSDDIAIEKSW